MNQLELFNKIVENYEILNKKYENNDEKNTISIYVDQMCQDNVIKIEISSPECPEYNNNDYCIYISNKVNEGTYKYKIIHEYCFCPYDDENSLSKNEFCKKNKVLPLLRRLVIRNPYLKKSFFDETDEEDRLGKLEYGFYINLITKVYGCNGFDIDQNNAFDDFGGCKCEQFKYQYEKLKYSRKYQQVELVE